jgi:hypothetical protein
MLQNESVHKYALQTKETKMQDWVTEMDKHFVIRGREMPDIGYATSEW